MLSSINYVRLQIRHAQTTRDSRALHDALRCAMDGLDRVEAQAQDAVATADALCAEVNELAGEFEDDDAMLVGLNGEEWSLDEVLAREG